jgi:hypothetical protein
VVRAGVALVLAAAIVVIALTPTTYASDIAATAAKPDVFEAPIGWSAFEPPLLGQAVSGGVGIGAVACGAPGRCFAFASYLRTGSGRETQILSGVDGSWTAEMSPAPVSPGPLACPNADTCVGLAGPEQVLLKSGGQWKVQRLPSDPRGTATFSPASVKCPTADWCAIVGMYVANTTYGVLPAAVVGTAGSWSLSAISLPADADMRDVSYRPSAGFNDLECPAVDNCVATGWYYSISGELRPFIAQQDSNGWRSVAPEPTDSGGTWLRSLACPAVRKCVAVGDGTHAYADGSIVMQTADGDWMTIAAPAPVDNYKPYSYSDSTLLSVACPVADVCFAVGSYLGTAPTEGVSAGPSEHLEVLSYRGGSWTAVRAPHSPSATGYVGSPLSAEIACSTGRACFVLGQEQNPTGSVLITYSDGAWSADEGPVPPRWAPWTGGAGSFVMDCAYSCVAAEARQDSPGHSTAVLLQEPTASRGADQPPPTSGGDGPLTVATPDPTGPLAVGVASGGGRGVAGAPDPSGEDRGTCDPGSDTAWLRAAGVTFICILSGDVWDDPVLLSAKRRCVISAGVDFLPFAKALKLPKYFKEAQTVRLALRELAAHIRVASYPAKLSRDAAAVADIETSLDEILNPNQAILTVISSKRIFGGLIVKLSKGGPAAVKVAREIAVVDGAVRSLIKVVSGAQDIEDCVAAFNGP